MKMAGLFYKLLGGLNLIFEILDYKVPRFKGGSNKVENIVGARSNCNQVKGSKSYKSFYNKKKGI